MEVQIVKTVNEYLRLIHRTEYFNFNWYRGHKEASYKLEPTAYRNKKQVLIGENDSIQLRHFEIYDEELAIKNYKKEYNRLIDSYEYSDLDYLYLMQHNGMDTRLLDFTSNPLIALFFSVAKTKEIKEIREYYDYDPIDEFREDASAVFCINPEEINNISFRQKKIIDLSHLEFKKIKNLLTPVCIEPQNYDIDPRLKVQSGKFVLFGSEVNPLDWYDITRKYMLKIIIPDSKRKTILNELDKKFNIKYTTVYPDKEGIKLFVEKKIEGKYKKL